MPKKKGLLAKLFQTPGSMAEEQQGKKSQGLKDMQEGFKGYGLRRKKKKKKDS